MAGHAIGNKMLREGEPRSKGETRINIAIAVSVAIPNALNVPHLVDYHAG